MDINFTFIQTKALSRAFYSSGIVAYELLEGKMEENYQHLGTYYIIRNQGTTVHIGNDKQIALMQFNTFAFTMKKEWENA